MKPFYSDQILVLATKEEFAKIRAALGCWLTHHHDWETCDTEEEVKYYKSVKQLLIDTTATMESMPF